MTVTVPESDPSSAGEYWTVNWRWSPGGMMIGCGGTVPRVNSALPDEMLISSISQLASPVLEIETVLLANPLVETCPKSTCMGQTYTSQVGVGVHWPTRSM